MKRLSVPGKVFLLGEYAVLTGMPAVLAAIPPRFVLESGKDAEGYPPGSPAGRLLAWAKAEAAPALRDPHQGAGGFGASTAAFALLYRELSEGRGWRLSTEAVWEKYRELHAGERIPPSGADLYTQWAGGVILFDPVHVSRSERLYPKSRLELLVLSASRQPGRKVATHEHLSALDISDSFSGLQSPLEAGIAAIRAGDAEALGEAFRDYGEVLGRLGLEIEETRRDREALSALPGVLGIKGTGALQADALVAILDPEISSLEKESLLSAARGRGLAPVFMGWSEEEGLRCES
jgi:mevalonate kinase